MFNIDQIRNLRQTYKLNESDVKTLIDLQSKAYDSYTSFFDEKQRMEAEGVTLKNISLADYLDLSYLFYKELSSSETVANEMIDEDKNFYAAACMLVAGRKPYYNASDVKSLYENPDEYENIMKSTLIKTALIIPLKKQLQELKKKAKNASSETYFELSSDINRLKNIYSFTSKIADDRLTNMHEENYQSLITTRKARYSEFDLDVVEYQMYCINSALAKIIKCQNKIENRRLRKAGNKSVLFLLSQTTFDRAEEKVDPAKDETDLDKD